MGFLWAHGNVLGAAARTCALAWGRPLRGCSRPRPLGRFPAPSPGGENPGAQLRARWAAVCGSSGLGLQVQGVRELRPPALLAQA